MSLESRIADLSTRIGTEFKTVRTEIAGAGTGDLLASNNLSELTNLVTARVNLEVLSETEINALVAGITLASLGGLTQAEVDARAQAIFDASVGLAPNSLDTIQELAAALNNNPNQINEIITGLGNRLRFDAAQTLSAGQRTQGQANLNVVDAAAIGNTDANFVTTFEAALL